MILPVILAGGTGKRLWPLSKTLYPKQFLPLFNQQTLLQTTLQRIHQVPGFLDPLIVCNRDCLNIALEQTRAILEPQAVLVEPVGRNTAPAAVLSALFATQQGADPFILLLPSDQYITNRLYFTNLIQTALEAASTGNIVTFGVKPNRPHTGYGYIKAGSPFLKTGAYQIEKFVEKPNAETAAKYVNSGEYYWNSGIFLFKASTLLRESEQHASILLDCCRSAFQAASRQDPIIHLPLHSLENCPNISIDNAIMEKTQHALMIPFESTWADLGDWSMIWQVSEKDDDQNNVIKGDVISVKNQNSYLHSNSRLIVAIGLNNKIVVETEEALLIADFEHAQEIKQVLDDLRNNPNVTATLT